MDIMIANVEEECSQLRKVFAEELRLEVFGDEGRHLPPPGREFRNKFFSFQQDFTILNAAAFGSLPIPLRHIQSRWRQLIEREPYRFHKYYMPKLMKLVVDDVRNYLGACGPHDLILTKNTSAGIYSVFRSLDSLHPGDVVLITSLCYHSIRDAALDLCSKVEGAECVIVPIALPVKSEAEIVAAFEESLETVKGRRIRLAVVEHIASKPSVVLPLKPILQRLNECNAPVMIDGAHAVGQVYFNGDCDDGTGVSLSKDLPSVAFYCGNFYKHCFGPRAVGFMFIDREAVAANSFAIEHLAPKDGAVVYDSRKSLTCKPRTAYLVDSLTQGIYDESTRDYAEFLLLPQVLQFRRYTCQSLVHSQYATELAVWTLSYLRSTWLTEGVVCRECAPTMVTARLPEDVVKKVKMRFPDENVTDSLLKMLLSEKKLSIALYEWHGFVLTRVSIELHTCRQDIVHLSDAVLSLVS